MLRITTEQLNDLSKLTQAAPTDYDIAIATLQRLLQWPKGKICSCCFLLRITITIDVPDLLFPILDIVRLAVRHERICSILVTPEFLQKLVESCSHSAANQLMITRCFVNMMNHAVGTSLVQNRFLDIVRELCKIKQGSGNLQVCSSESVDGVRKRAEISSSDCF